MGEFIFNRGRSRTAHSYPDTRAGTNSPPVSALARNYAFGPALEASQAIAVSPGTQVQWGSIDQPGTVPALEDVPITPRVSGIIMVRGVLTVRNVTADPADVQVQIQVDDVTYPVPASEEVTVPAENSGEETEGATAIPFMVEIPSLAIGTTVKIQVLLTAFTADALILNDNSSTIEVQEVLPATG